jgi:hypothetical protein
MGFIFYDLGVALASLLLFFPLTFLAVLRPVPPAAISARRASFAAPTGALAIAFAARRRRAPRPAPSLSCWRRGLLRVGLRGAPTRCVTSA